ncbi:hypothetical protein PQR33_32205 [Paraburkholderia sediminicola]|uniref:hypothetical protein n=1 Tax=Paraburkholderia sediminicola TaxID=458836 RepID=UPI0038BCD902
MMDLQRSEWIKVDRGERRNAALVPVDCTHHAIGGKTACRMLLRRFPSKCDGDRPTGCKAMSAIRRHPSDRHVVMKLAENHVTIDRYREPCAWRAGFAESRQQGKENA